jgi:AcrR family transcriptional regulator
LKAILKEETSKATKGELRARVILESAENILINHGYHNFTLRKIAQDAGISMGNLQYYFPTKDELIRALCDRIVSDYTGVFEEFLKIEHPQEQFKGLISHTIRELNNRRTTILFPELWSLANHDDYVSSILDSLYEPPRRILTSIIRRMNPALDEKQAHLLSVYITSAIEGFTMFVGHKKPWEKETEKFVDLSIRGFTLIVMTGDTTAGQA